MLLNIFIILIVIIAVFALPPHFINIHEDRIVNGTDVPIGKYPSQISLQTSFGSHTCGGSILNENWVLTAAHCVYANIPRELIVLSGTTVLSEGGIRHQVTEIIAHENYTYGLTENDIALIKISPKFEWDSTTKPVILPIQDKETPEGSVATVIGWGLNFTGGLTMDILQEVDYFIVNDEKCEQAHIIQVFSTNICAYYPGGGKGECSGDSGGPLFVNGYQAGIVSWSMKPCTIAPYPGVFTEVSAYVNWINANVIN